MLFLRRAHSPVKKKEKKEEKKEEALFKQTALSKQALYTALYTQH